MVAAGRSPPPRDDERGPRPQTIHELVTVKKRDADTNGSTDTQGPTEAQGRTNDDGSTHTEAIAEKPSMRAAFEKAYGTKLAERAISETEKWLTVEKLQSHLHGMTNKQPLVLEFEGIPGAWLEVHAFIEPIGTPAAPGHTNHGGAGRERMMRPTGETKETEFHYGTEADTSQTRQDAVTRSRQWPMPGRARGQGGTDSAEAQGRAAWTPH